MATRTSIKVNKRIKYLFSLRGSEFRFEIFGGWNMNKRIKNAYEELIKHLEGDEKIECIIFGPWGWDGFEEPEPYPVPHDLFGKILTPEKAKKYMKGWSFYSGIGAPECYAAWIYTNKRIFWISTYDGATGLDSCPRNPVEGKIPCMSGG